MRQLDTDGMNAVLYLIELAAWPIAIAGGCLAWHVYMRLAWRALGA